MTCNIVKVKDAKKGATFEVEICIHRPKFSDIWNAFPSGLTSREAYALVGGEAYELHLEKESYANACALRMSEALNKGGYVIKSNYSDGFDGYRVRGKMLDTETLPGRKYYAYYVEVEVLEKFFDINFGSADLVFKNGSDALSQLTGKSGIVIFKIDGWTDARGHAAIWNGSEFADGNKDNYFQHPGLSLVKFWELKD